MRSTALGSRRLRLAGRLALLLALALVGGCGAGRGKVSGQVLFNRAPLPGGLVTFWPADPKHSPVSVHLDEEGHYEAVLPVGEVRVGIDNRHLQPRVNLQESLVSGLNLPPELRNKPGGGKPPPERSGTAETHLPKEAGRYVKIPNKYYDLDHTDLKFTVTGGDQQQDFELKDSELTD
jgi:hypothetical protein